MLEYYRPYFEAVQTILNGTAVKDLDQIRENCNKKFMDKAPPLMKALSGYSAEAIVLTALAEAENRILMGEDPIEAYSKWVGVNPIKCRRMCRQILEDTIKEFLK